MATDPRNARSQSAYSNSAARLPSLPTVRVIDPQMQRFVDALRVWVDARSGARDIFEKAVTMRDLVQLGLVDGALLSRGTLSTADAPPGKNIVVAQTPGGSLVLDNEAFARTIMDTRVFNALMKSLNDPSRFDMLPDAVREIVRISIADEAAKRGADIRRVEQKLQSDTQSIATAVDEVTAAVTNSVAGVRQTVFAVAEEGRAVAGTVTQIEARVDGVPIPVDQIDSTVYATLAALQTAVPVNSRRRGLYYQVDDPASTDNTLYLWDGSVFYIAGRGTTASATATIEEQAIAIADRAQGVEAQYTLKVQAGNKVAGFGIAATDNDQDGATSAFIVAADKFAIVDPNDNTQYGNSPPLKRIPFGVDTVNDVIYINGQVRINAGGTRLNDVVSGALLIDLSNEQFEVATDKDGNNGAFGTHTQTTPIVMRGVVDETSLWTFSISATNCTSSIWNGSTWVAGPVSGIAAPTVRVTAMSADNCTVTITATRTGNPTLTAQFTGTKRKAGADGAAATVRNISSPTPIVRRMNDGSADPASITFEATSVTGTGTPAAYSGYIRVYTIIGATETKLTDPGSPATSRAVTVPASVTAIRGELYADAAFTTLYDKETIRVASDGADGDPGDRGSLTGYGSKYSIYVPNGNPPSWSDAKANRVINNMITGETSTSDLATTTHLRVGDTVTLTNNPPTWAETRYWGPNWVTIGVVIDGNLLVNGTITGDKIGANEITAAKINGAGLSIEDGKIFGGDFTSWSWPAAGGTGFYLGAEGLRIGNSNNGRYASIDYLGNVYAPQFSIINGAATFSGALSAASGTFAGTLTASAVEAVDTVNIKGQAVTVPLTAQHFGTYTPAAGNDQYIFNGSTGFAFSMPNAGKIVCMWQGEASSLRQGEILMYLNDVQIGKLRMGDAYQDGPIIIGFGNNAPAGNNVIKIRLVTQFLNWGSLFAQRLVVLGAQR